MKHLAPYSRYAIIGSAIIFTWFATFAFNGIDVSETQLHCNLDSAEKSQMDLCSRQTR